MNQIPIKMQFLESQVYNVVLLSETISVHNEATHINPHDILMKKRNSYNDKCMSDYVFSHIYTDYINVWHEIAGEWFPTFSKICGFQPKKEKYHINYIHKVFDRLVEKSNMFVTPLFDVRFQEVSNEQ